MSSETKVKIFSAENPRFPSQRSSGTGQSELRQAPPFGGGSTMYEPFNIRLQCWKCNEGMTELER